jgi:hypothetical protein
MIPDGQVEGKVAGLCVGFVAGARCKLSEMAEEIGSGAGRIAPPGLLADELPTAAQRAARWCGSCACDTSAIIFSTMASPNALKSFATRTNAMGPPITLSR